MKTYSAKPQELTHRWYLVDASDQILGRLASTVAQCLIGKHKPTYTSHLWSGDHVVVINAASIKVTGQKLEQKNYYHYSGYPGGLRSTTLAEQLQRDPTKVIEHAVRGMLPKNKLRDTMLTNLKVYPGAEHPHSGQTPEKLELTSWQ